MSDTDMLAHPGRDFAGEPSSQAIAFPVIKTRTLSRGSATGAQAALSRMVGRGLYAGLPGADAQLSIHLAEDAIAGWPQPLILSGASGVIDIADGARLMRALTGIDLDALPQADERQRGWFLAAAAGRLAGTPLASMDGIASVGQAGGGDLLRLTVRTGRHAVTALARAEAATWLAVLSNTAWSRERLPLSACLGLPFDTTVCLARHRLPASAMRNFAAGDIVLPDSPAFACDGTGSIRLGGLQWRVCYRAPHSLEIISMGNTLETEELNDFAAIAAPDTAVITVAGAGARATDTTDAAGAAPDASAAQLDMVPLTLVFELGRVGMSLSDMRALGPQTILSLKEGSPASIAIVCSGRMLGRGEAVDVDGSLGIRITQWGGAC